MACKPFGCLPVVLVTGIVSLPMAYGGLPAWLLTWALLAGVVLVPLGFYRFACDIVGGPRAGRTTRAARPSETQTLGRSQELARLKAELKGKIDLLGQTSGLSPDEVRDARTRLERDFLRAVESLMG